MLKTSVLKFIISLKISFLSSPEMGCSLIFEYDRIVVMIFSQILNQ